MKETADLKLLYFNFEKGDCIMKRLTRLIPFLLFTSIFCVAGGNPEREEAILVEAESFDSNGGWFM